MPRWTAGAALAAGLAAVAVLGGAAIFGQARLGPLGPDADAEPIRIDIADRRRPTPSPSSETFDVLSPAQILERRANGTLGTERIDVWGYYSAISFPAPPWTAGKESPRTMS